ncbi:Fc.00g109300.m01.CDS01 [Cosmosporella sp. VM-42]
MSKRSAVEAAPNTPSSKRYREDPDDLYIDDVDDDITTAHTPSSIAEVDSPSTIQTGATTPRTKFPSDLKTLACTWPGCPKTFNRPARLRDHLNSHTNSRPFKCPYAGCDKDYIEDKHLKQHIKAVHTLERKHVCPREGCGKSFVTGTRLKRHQAVHEGEERFRCQDCGQSFRKKETLSKHVRKDHRGLPAHQCPEEDCDAAFDSKPALKRHREREHGEAKYWCGECGLKRQPDGTEQRVGFTTETLLQAHVRQEHQNCLFCDFKSSSRYDLDKHVEMYHSGKTVEDRKNISCPYENCIKKFTKKSNLNAHVRTAHEGFRFVCGDVDLSNADLPGWMNDQGCGDKFCTKVRLEDHVRYKHLGQERPKLSGIQTSQSVDPIDELTGATIQAKQTIVCPHCDEGFIRYHDLDLHIQKMHDPTNLPGPDPALFLSEGQLVPEQSLFGEDYGAPSAWPEDMQQDEIFAAQMDYGPVPDEWQEDEANILLLARGYEVEPIVDPALGEI